MQIYLLSDELSKHREVSYLHLFARVLEKAGHECFQVGEISLSCEGSHYIEVLQILISVIFSIDLNLFSLMNRLVVVPKVEGSLKHVEKVEVIHFRIF